MSSFITTVIGWALVCVYAFGAMVLMDNEGWYALAKRPKWQPPNWLFGVLWPLHYFAIGVVFWFAPDLMSETARVWLVLGFAAATATGLAWTWLFYSARKLRTATWAVFASALITVPWLALVASADLRLAALLIPYQLWLFTASALSDATTKLN